MTATTTLQIERSFDAPAQAVFDAWTSEEVLRRWFHAEHDWETTQAEVEFEEIDGITKVRFTHSGLWDEEAVRSHRGGWNRCFDNLQRALHATHPKR